MVLDFIIFQIQFKYLEPQDNEHYWDPKTIRVLVHPSKKRIHHKQHDILTEISF